MSSLNKKRKVERKTIVKNKKQDPIENDEDEDVDDDDNNDDDVDDEDDNGDESNSESGDDSDVAAAKQKLKIKTNKEQKKMKNNNNNNTVNHNNDDNQVNNNNIDSCIPLFKTFRISAATLKTKMSPSKLQNPIARKTIWNNFMKMITLRGYTWEKDREAPTDYEQLLPTKGILGFFHMHAVHNDKKLEPIYVILCAKAGSPNLEKLQYPSRHILLVSDGITGRARASLQNLPLKHPPVLSPSDLKHPKPTFGATTTVPTKDNIITLKDIYIEPFFSDNFMFGLLDHRYLSVVKFEMTNQNELQQVFDVFEKQKDITHFPKMTDQDPVSRYHRLTPGEVLKLQRLSTPAGILNAYRAIIKTNI